MVRTLLGGGPGADGLHCRVMISIASRFYQAQGTVAQQRSTTVFIRLPYSGSRTTRTTFTYCQAHAVGTHDSCSRFVHHHLWVVCRLHEEQCFCRDRTWVRGGRRRPEESRPREKEKGNRQTQARPIVEVVDVRLRNVCHRDRKKAAAESEEAYCYSG